MPRFSGLPLRLVGIQLHKCFATQCSEMHISNYSTAVSLILALLALENVFLSAVAFIERIMFSSSVSFYLQISNPFIQILFKCSFIGE